MSYNIYRHRVIISENIRVLKLFLRIRYILTTNITLNTTYIFLMKIIKNKKS